MPATRFRFGEFTLSPSRRLLLRGGEEVRLIPRYFDLLVLLVERRGEAVSRREIFEQVWSDVVVSDGALTQAVRTLRRALGDHDVREPAFIRTVSRHGYRFVQHVAEEQERGETPGPPAPAPSPPAGRAGADAPEEALGRLLDPDLPEEQRRAAAEALHTSGTEEALRRLEGRADPQALALMKDARWDVPGAGEVPLLGRPGGLRALARLAWARLRGAARVAGGRWASA
ncbi:MAG TPA: transcriptional regulator, partial [Candidatus Polarisedimenticolia bacterium]|nr:transcriptional regulator [Candidatus Polarisedimenticolia bacterium]